MKKPKKTTQPPERNEFSLVGLNYNYEYKPTNWPVLEIHATAFWYSDRIKTPNPDTLTAEITKTIEKAFLAKGLNHVRVMRGHDTKKKGGAK